MINSKQKILHSLINVQTLKKEQTNFVRYEPSIQIVHSLFVLYFIVINSDDVLINPVFAPIKVNWQSIQSFDKALL